MVEIIKSRTNDWTDNVTITTSFPRVNLLVGFDESNFLLLRHTEWKRYILRPCQLFIQSSSELNSSFA